MRLSRDIRASVANLSPRNFGEFTMRNFRDTRTTVARQSCENLATIWRENKTKRHSYECRATLSRDIFSKLDRNSRICRKNVYSMRLQRESCVYIVYLCREIVANYSRTSLQLSHSSEIGALASPRFLAHLSRRLTGELIVYPCSAVRRRHRRRCRPHFSNNFSSETAGPIKVKLHMEHP